MGNYAKTISNNGIRHIKMSDFEFMDILKSGVYSIVEESVGPMSSEMVYYPSTILEELIQFKTGVSSDIIKAVDNFFTSKTKGIYKELKMAHKMGMLLHGPPGTGKTCTATLVMNEIAKNYNALCLIGTDTKLSTVIPLLTRIRKVQNNPIVLFFDEIEHDIKHGEQSFLNFLDGSNSIENCVLIGCTNYLDQIPDRIKNRKSRIKHVFEIKSFPYEVYKQYIITKIPSLTQEILHKFCYIAVDNGVTLDQLKHAVLDYKLNDEKDDIATLIKSVKQDCKVEY